MKTNFLKSIFFITSFVIFSCSSNDSTGNSNETTSFLPTTSGNYWNYEITTSSTDNPTAISRDSLFVSGDTLINGISYKKMKTNLLPAGFYSNTLRNNGLRVDGNTIKMTGSAVYDLGIGEPITIGVTDFILLKDGATSNEQLSSLEGTFSETISGYPLNFEYKLKSINNGEVASFTSPNGDVYENVIKTKVVMNLKITTTQTIGGFPVTITLLAPQDVVTSYQFYAENIGNVHTNTEITYQLQEIPGVTLPIPSSGSQSQNEYLDTYLVN